ncbi:MAG: hypothetical protein KDD43_12300 [Bdellovibrionales bacterium]|nr:hypothetical protein [Bdellovibrionales bacterium]
MRSRKSGFILLFLVSLYGVLSYGGANKEGKKDNPPPTTHRGAEVMASPGEHWEDIAPTGFPTVWVEKSPWWQVKEKAARRIKDERAVLVSVVAEEKNKERPLNRLRMTGAGHMKSPANFSFDRVREFHRLKDLSDYVRESTFDEKKSRLYLHVAAFNYHARMLMEIVFQKPEKGQHQILFHIVTGTMQGLRGVVQLEDVERRGAEISMTAFYDYDKLPIPQFFIEFGLEVVLQKMAETLRAHVEELWLKSSSPAKSEEAPKAAMEK